MFAVGNVVLGIQFAIRDDLGEGVHNLCIWPDRIRGDDVHIRQPHGLRDRLAAGQQILAFVNVLYFRSEEHTSELQSLAYLVCRLLLEKKKKEHRILHWTDNMKTC